MPPWRCFCRTMPPSRRVDLSRAGPPYDNPSIRPCTSSRIDSAARTRGNPGIVERSPQIGHHGWTGCARRGRRVRWIGAGEAGSERSSASCSVIGLRRHPAGHSRPLAGPMKQLALCVCTGATLVSHSVDRRRVLGNAKACLSRPDSRLQSSKGDFLHLHEPRSYGGMRRLKSPPSSCTRR